MHNILIVIINVILKNIIHIILISPVHRNVCIYLRATNYNTT